MFRNAAYQRYEHLNNRTFEQTNFEVRNIHQWLCYFFYASRESGENLTKGLKILAKRERSK
jgi:hypothetical protein